MTYAANVSLIPYKQFCLSDIFNLYAFNSKYQFRDELKHPILKKKTKN